MCGVSGAVTPHVVQKPSPFHEMKDDIEEYVAASCRLICRGIDSMKGARWHGTAESFKMLPKGGK